MDFDRFQIDKISVIKDLITLLTSLLLFDIPVKMIS